MCVVVVVVSYFFVLLYVFGRYASQSAVVKECALLTHATRHLTHCRRAWRRSVRQSIERAKKLKKSDANFATRYARARFAEAF